MSNEFEPINGDEHYVLHHALRYRKEGLAETRDYCIKYSTPKLEVVANKLNSLIDQIDELIKEVATATGNPTISVKNRQNHLINSPNGAMNGDA